MPSSSGTKRKGLGVSRRTKSLGMVPLMEVVVVAEAPMHRQEMGEGSIRNTIAARRKDHRMKMILTIMVKKRVIVKTKSRRLKVLSMC